MTKFDVNYYAASDVSLDEVFDRLKYPNSALSEETNDLPMGIHESPPCFGKKPVSVSCEIHDENTVSLIYLNTFSYCSRSLSCH